MVEKIERVETVGSEKRPKTIAQIRLLGGQLCLDFINTIEGRDDASPTEYLHSYQDLIVWSKRLGQIDETVEVALLALAAQHPKQTIAVYQQTIELRETLYRIFAAIASERMPAVSDVDKLNEKLGAALTHRYLMTSGNNFQMGWRNQATELTSPLWPVVQAAVELLTGEELPQIHECPGDHCNWLFVDRSRNHSRRWCNMQTCGNLDKVRNFNKRQQLSSAKELN